MENKFKAAIDKIVSSKKRGDNIFYFSSEEYNNKIQKIKELKIGTLKKTVTNNRLIRKYDVVSIGGKEKLIKPIIDNESDVLYYVTVDELFEVIHTAHLTVGHGGRNRMMAVLKTKYCNVTTEAVMAYLGLCSNCQVKQSNPKRGLVTKPILHSAFNSRAQIDLIDMQSQNYNNYRYIMNYQDHLTKFVILKPLKTKRAEEIALNLIDIYTIFGAPAILHSDNGREFLNSIITNLNEMWGDIKIVHHGKPRHSQTQGSIERANRDVEEILASWMADNKSKDWPMALKFVQFQKNRALNSGAVRQIFAVVHGTALLPCDIAPPIPHDPLDTVILVVWYRYEKTAIYSVDIRDKFTDPNKSHWKDESLEGRSHFRMLSEPAMLTIDNVSEMDAGIYRCRVDFRKSPTRNSRLNLTVIVPPQKPVILSEYNEEIEHTGPFYEGDRVKLTCMVSGGRPEPKVRWWRGETLMDTGNEGISGQFTASSSSVKQNEMTIEALGRYDQGAVYTCQASNSNLSAPVSARVTIEMYLKPLEVQVLSSRQPLSCGRTYEVQCQAVGSKPPANVTWWKDNERLTNATQTVSPDGNVTSSTLTFQPTKSDNGKSLVCRAENQNVQQLEEMAGGKVEDSWTIDVHYVPILKLALGINMNPADIEEGDDVYFECKIDANPPAYKVIWKHNGQVLQGNVKSGVIMNQKDLALQNVKRQQAGNYSCLASNVEGDGESNVVRLTVMYKPVCRHNQKLTYGVARNENTEIVCEVDAYPAPDVFKWTFNRTGGVASEIGSNEVVQHTRPGGTETGSGSGGSSSGKRGKLSSVLTYSPSVMGMGGGGGGSGNGGNVGDNDYGTVTCRASNTAGQQMEPCVFHVIAAVRPDPPFNCTSGDRTLFSVHVWCTQGFDGGVAQRFALEAYDSAGRAGAADGGPSGPDDGYGGPAVAADGPAPPMLANLTADRPDFTLRQLSPSVGLRLAVYAYNSRGTSDRTWLTAYTLNSADKQTTSGSSAVGAGGNDRFRLTPVVAGLLAITIVSAVAAAAVMCALRVRSRRHQNQRRQDLCGAGTGSVMGGGIGGGAAVIAVCKQKADDDDDEYAAAASDPDKNPDLIPPTKIKSGSRGNIGYRVVQQQPMMGLNDDDDENLDAAESSDDERSGYPTLPVDGIGSRPSVSSLRHPTTSVGPGYSNNGYRPEQHMSTTIAVSSRLPPYHHREIVTVRTPLMSSQQESCV